MSESPETPNTLSSGPNDDVESVRNHYERWPFPDTFFSSREGLLLLKHVKEILKPDPSKKLNVIDVGCGTGHSAIALAGQFTDVRFVGLDLSSTAIQKAELYAREKGLKNITFVQGDILDRDRLPPGLFDLMISTGVLHHIKNVTQAFVNLLSLLKADGHVIFWLYGRHGRMRHSLNQAFIDILTRGHSMEEREHCATEFVGHLGPQFAVHSGFYTPYGSGSEGLNWLIRHRQWLADQMIPPFEHCYTMEEILSLLHAHRVKFTKWLGVITRLEAYTTSAALIDHFNKLPFEERLIAIDYLIKPEYYFVSGQKEG